MERPRPRPAQGPHTATIIVRPHACIMHTTAVAHLFGPVVGDKKGLGAVDVHVDLQRRFPDRGQAMAVELAAVVEQQVPRQGLDILEN